MKFIKVITEHTQEEMDGLVSEFDEITFDRLLNLYNSFNYVEFYTEEGKTAMYASLYEHQIEQLFSEFIKHEVKFSYEDTTKQILFGNLPILEDEKLNKNLQGILNLFIDENLDTDVVLDKISEMGISSISERDKKILNSQSI
jgi:hypothetical protein